MNRPRANLSRIPRSQKLLRRNDYWTRGSSPSLPLLLHWWPFHSSFVWVSGAYLAGDAQGKHALKRQPLVVELPLVVTRNQFIKCQILFIISRPARQLEAHQEAVVETARAAKHEPKIALHKVTICPSWVRCVACFKSPRYAQSLLHNILKIHFTLMY